MQTVGDLFSAQCYVNSNNSGYLGTQDILTGQLNNVAQRMAVGGQISYDWFWSGWSPTTRRQYRGLAKCMYVMGTIGGNSGSYSSHDFVSPFNENAPPDWLADQIDLSHVHAEFSYLEDYIRNGSLVNDGKFRHYWSNDLPAYELLPLELQSQTEDMGTFKRMLPGRAHRVLARKHNAKDEWLVVAWTAAAGSDDVETPLTVDLPIAGRLNLNARAAGNLYLIRLVNGQTTSQLLDPNQDFPSQALASGVLPAETVQPGSVIIYGVGDNARFVSQVVSTQVTSGSSYAFSITVQNVGDNIWPAGGEWRLGSQNARDNTTWGLARVQMPSTVGPGQQVTFDFIITAPTTPGSYDFQWQMVHDGVVWFGDSTTNTVVSVIDQVPTDPAPLIGSGDG